MTMEVGISFLTWKGWRQWPSVSGSQQAPDLTAGWWQHSSVQGRHSGQWQGMENMRGAGAGGRELVCLESVSTETASSASLRFCVLLAFGLGFKDTEADLSRDLFCDGGCLETTSLETDFRPLKTSGC